MRRHHTSEKFLSADKRKRRDFTIVMFPLILACGSLFVISANAISNSRKLNSYDQQQVDREDVEIEVIPEYEDVGKLHELLTHTSDGAIEKYPFTGLGDVSSPPTGENQVGFYWQIPRSGGTTLKHILGICLNLVQSSRTSVEYCDVESHDLHVCQTRLGSLVNADTSDDHGIQRSQQLGLVPSGLVDVVVSSRFLHAASLFDTEHTARSFTVMRDPLERTISTFYYLKEATWERNYDEFYKHMTLMEYIQRDETSSDWMVRWLTGKQHESVLTTKDLEFAKEILRKKFLILLTEEMRVSVDRLIRYMNWDDMKDEACLKENVAKVSRHNKSLHPNIEIGTEEYKAMREKNKLDIDLYDFALELFSEQWEIIHTGADVHY